MSDQEQYTEVGRLLVEHGNRRREFALVIGKIKRIAQVFLDNQQVFNNLNPDSYSASLQGIRSQLAPPGTAEHASSGIVALMHEYDRVRDHLSRDLETLKEYGVR